MKENGNFSRISFMCCRQNFCYEKLYCYGDLPVRKGVSNVITMLSMIIKWTFNFGILHSLLQSLYHGMRPCKVVWGGGSEWMTKRLTSLQRRIWQIAHNTLRWMEVFCLSTETRGTTKELSWLYPFYRLHKWAISHSWKAFAKRLLLC